MAGGGERLNEADKQGNGQWLPNIERVNVSTEEIAGYTREDQFNELSANLMIECGSWTCVAANLYPADTRCWNRNQAILGGLLVRSYKLTSAILDQTRQGKRETTFLFGRLAFECLVNIQYLLRQNSAELFDAFVINSLRHEKRLRETITENIERRGGAELPIERRMLNSIDRAFSVSGVSIEQVTNAAAKPWKAVDLYRKAEAVGLGQAYLGLFGGPSHAVHGGWQDLLDYHLDVVDGGFTADLAWHRPRPQLLLTIGRLGVETLKAYIPHFTEAPAKEVLAKLDDLLARIEHIDNAHEDFLIRCQQRKANLSPNPQ